MWRSILLAWLLLVPQAVQAAWQEARSDHFTVYSNDRPEAVRKLATQLEQFDSALRLLTGAPAMPSSLSSRVTIFVVDDIGDIRRLIGGGGGRVAGFMQNRASGSVAFVPRRSDGNNPWPLSSQTILLHEYAHHFMFQNWPNGVYPLWYTEGFAEFCANVRFDEDGKLVIGISPAYRAWNMGSSNLLPARMLLKLNPGRLTEDQTATLYARGWLLLHYLLMGKDRPGQLGRYIKAINEGTGADEAGAVFGDPSRLDRDMTRHADQRRLPAFTIANDRLAIGDIAVRPLSSGEAAMMEVRIRQDRGVSRKAATQLVATARTAAAPYGEDAGVQNILADAEYDAGNHAAAEAAADRALRADPRSIHAMIYKGMAMQALAQKDGVTDPARWKAIRDWYRAANKSDPEYAWPLILFYYSFDASGKPATDNAIAGLLYAHALAPFDNGLRILAARLLIQKDRLDDARRTFAPIAYRAEQDETARNWAMSVLAALDARDAKAAAARLTTPPADDAPNGSEMR